MCGISSKGIRIPKSEKFVHVESGIPLTIGIQNQVPVTKPESSTWIPESTGCSLEAELFEARLR